MVYLALLRGVNVGGKNKIKMAELKTAFEDAGLASVQTYIQSGNVLFRSELNEVSLRELIKKTILTRFNLTVPVVLRTDAELDALIGNLPFTNDDITKAQAGTDAEVLYTALLNEAPTEEKTEQFLKYKNTDEQLHVAGRDVYLLFAGSIRHSKLAGHLTKLDESATTRNLKTLVKLSQLAAAMSKTT